MYLGYLETGLRLALNSAPDPPLSKYWDYSMQYHIYLSLTGALKILFSSKFLYKNMNVPQLKVELTGKNIDRHKEKYKHTNNHL